MLLRFLLARWRKLLKSFYNEKKQQFDISKVPDIYDSAKYDAIHNSHLQLTCLKVSSHRQIGAALCMCVVHCLLLHITATACCSAVNKGCEETGLAREHAVGRRQRYHSLNTLPASRPFNSFVCYIAVCCGLVAAA
jgi:hypothetical protein